MPKRVIDGEALWRSDKLARVEPTWVRGEYANLVPLALANGVFECNAKRIWSLVYSYNRPHISVEDVQAVLGALERAGLLFRWTDPNGKTWGYWVGIERPGRLPPPSRRGEHEAIGPEPPPEQFKKFLASRNLASQRVANGCLGLGSGFGFGSGLGSRRARHLSATRQNDGGQPDATSATGPAVRNEADPAERDGAGSASPPEEWRDEAHPAERDGPRELLAIFREECGALPCAEKLTPERESKCRARLNAHRNALAAFLGEFRQAVARAAKTPFLCGENDRRWKASFDWFIANDTNYVKVLEGSYDGKAVSRHEERTRGNLEAARQYLERRGALGDPVRAALPAGAHRP